MEKLLSVHEVAELLGVPVSTVYRWRYEGTGPIGLKVGRHVRYDPAELRRWLASHRDDREAVDAGAQQTFRTRRERRPGRRHSHRNPKGTSSVNDSPEHTRVDTRLLEDDGIRHFTCNACDGVDQHEPTCVVTRCPHCGVTADDAIAHGHRSDCPRHVRDPLEDGVYLVRASDLTPQRVDYL